MSPASDVLPPLLLLPGLLNDAELWREPMALLADVADCRVGDFTGSADIGAAAAKMLAEAPPRFALAGFSLGGYVAQEMLRQAPERIERLALIDTSCRPDTDEQARRRASAARVAQLARGRFSGFGENIAERFMAPAHSRDEAMVARVRSMTTRLGAEVFLRQNGWQRKDGRALLAAYPGPALVVCGALDRVTPPPLSEEMAALLPDGELVMVPDSGHLTPIERPQPVAAALRAWLARGR